MVSNLRQGQKKQPKISNEIYEAELFRLQIEFVKLQEWVRFASARIVVIFEGASCRGTSTTMWQR
jgi:polyphosphate kinase 2 (PPK2 family)